MQWSSRLLYEGRLRSAAAVEGWLLRDLPHVVDDENTSEPLVFIDTAGEHSLERVVVRSKSWLSCIHSLSVLNITMVRFLHLDLDVVPHLVVFTYLLLM